MRKSLLMRATGRIAAGALLALPMSSIAADGVSAGTDGIFLTAADGAVELTLGGRLQLDAVAFDDDVADFEDADWRRARIELSGKIADVVRFRVDREFAGVDGWRNVWVSVRPMDSLEIKGGNFSVPFSMEDLQSSNRGALMERSLATALTPGFSVGGGVQYSRSHWTVAAGYFGDALANEDGRADERGRGFAGRITVVPVNRGGTLVHLGAAVERRSFSADERARFQANAGSQLAPTLIRTGAVSDVDHLTNLGGEVALSRGPFLVQGQYVSSRMTRLAEPTLNFDGWYVQASWVVTGQRYRYSRRAGIVSGVDLGRRGGAVELAARYSRLDFNDGAFQPGRATALTLGASWYINDNVRLMANYVRSTARDVAGDPDRTGNLFAARVQLSF